MLYLCSVLFMGFLFVCFIELCFVAFMFVWMIGAVFFVLFCFAFCCLFGFF